MLFSRQKTGAQAQPLEPVLALQSWAGVGPLLRSVLGLTMSFRRHCQTCALHTGQMGTEKWIQFLKYASLKPDFADLTHILSILRGKNDSVKLFCDNTWVRTKNRSLGLARACPFVEQQWHFIGGTVCFLGEDTNPQLDSSNRNYHYNYLPTDNVEKYEYAFINKNYRSWAIKPSVYISVVAHVQFVAGTAVQWKALRIQLLLVKGWS